MKETDVLANAFAMPLTSPAFPCGPYRFVNREYLIITYRTDPERLRAVVPEPLEVAEPLVKYEFIRMPDSTGFGDYTETGQVIPVTFRGKRGGYTHCMFLNDEPPIAGGRELWGFPKKLANPSLRTEIDMLVATSDYGPVRVATATMGYKHKQADLDVLVRNQSPSAGLQNHRQRPKTPFAAERRGHRHVALASDLEHLFPAPAAERGLPVRA